jgi:hypothetical protein
VGDANDDGVAHRNLQGLGGARGDGIELLDFEVALLRFGRLLGRLRESEDGAEE